jgi:hypothetical protein
MSCLPNDILLYIFEYCFTSTLYIGLTVNQHWYHLIRCSRKIWYHRPIEFTKRQIETVNYLDQYLQSQQWRIQHCTQLFWQKYSLKKLALWIYNSPTLLLISDFIQQFISIAKHLHTIDLCYNSLFFIDPLLTLPNLVSLHITILDQHPIVEIQRKGLQSMTTNITDLQIIGCITPPWIVQACPQLQILKIYNPTLESASCIQALHYLTTFILSASPYFFDAELQLNHQLKLISGNTNIKTFKWELSSDIQNNMVRNFIYFKPAFVNFASNLTSLVLKSYGTLQRFFIDMNISDFFICIGECIHVTYLSVIDSIGDMPSINDEILQPLKHLPLQSMHFIGFSLKSNCVEI